MSKCATIGCTNRAEYAMTYRYAGEDMHDNVCTECAESYQLRPALRATVVPL